MQHRTAGQNIDLSCFNTLQPREQISVVAHRDRCAQLLHAHVGAELVFPKEYADRSRAKDRREPRLLGSLRVRQSGVEGAHRPGLKPPKYAVWTIAAVYERSRANNRKRAQPKHA